MSDLFPLGYAYLASPYRDSDPDIMEARCNLAQQAAAWLVHQGFVVYSPIAHWHPIAAEWDETVIRYWEKQDRIMLRDAKEGIIILQIAGWCESQGVNMEIEWALANAQPIREMTRTYNAKTGEISWIIISVLGDPRRTHSHKKTSS